MRKKNAKKKVLKINISLLLSVIIGLIILISAVKGYQVIKVKVETNVSNANTETTNTRYFSLQEDETEEEDTSKYSRAYQEYLKLSDEEKANLSVIPRKYTVSLDMLYEDETEEDVSLSSSSVTSSTELADSFDLRDEIEIDTKDQGDLGLCYAFASLRSVQTNLLLNGYDNYDFSELYLAFMALDGFSGEEYTDGGNFSDLENCLAYGFEPVLETDMPYDSEYTEDDYEYIYNLSPAVYVSETVNFPTIDKMYEEYTDEELELFRDTVKQHITENGSVYATIASSYIKEINDYNTLFNDSYELSDHAISIIGWDDNFSKENFTNEDGENPVNDGAWIAINSWGTDTEIIYISYEDILVETEMSGIVSATDNIDEVSQDIQFNDENLYNYLKEELRKAVISYDDENLILTCINSKLLIMLDLTDENISDLTGIENFENLYYLNLSINDISDISCLDSLTNLELLNLEENQLEDLSSLSSLPDLSYLYIAYNNINDITFTENLSDLCYIDLRYNNVEDISSLQTFVSNNDYAELYLSGNPITDGFEILVQDSESIYSVEMDDCGFDDEFIGTLSNMDINICELSLANNDITDVSALENIEELYYLDLSGNVNLDISTIPSNINIAVLENCNISDISSLTSENITSLDLSYNLIEDISSLSEISTLYELELRGNYITDISALNNIEELIYLDLSENENLTGLESLYLESIEYLILENCGLTDISFLTNLTSLIDVYLGGNYITEIPDMEGMDELYALDLSSNLITEMPDLSDINVMVIDLSYNYISNLNTEYLPQNGYTVKIDLTGNLLTEIPDSTYYQIDFSENYISEVTDEENLYTLCSQTIYINYSTEDETTNVDMPSILEDAYITRYMNYYLLNNEESYSGTDYYLWLVEQFYSYGNGYEEQTTFETDGCSLDFETGTITLESTDTATITVNGGKASGTVVTISSETDVELVSISVETAPTKTEYTEGETFDTTGMTVIATFSDGSTQEITDYEISPSEALTTSDTYVTISYTENGVTATTTQEITVTASSEDDNNSSDDTSNSTDTDNTTTNDTTTNDTTDNTSSNSSNSTSNSNSSNNSSNSNSSTSSNTDSTTSTSSLPYTGAKTIIIGIIAILGIITVVIHKKWNNLDGI